MRTLLYNSYLDFIWLLKEKKYITYALLLFSLVCIGLSVYRVVIYMSDFNMFIDPAVDAKFFDKNPVNAWQNNSYSPFFYSVMGIFSSFSRWFAVLIWSVISLISLIITLKIANELLLQQNKLTLKQYLVGFFIMTFSLVDNFQLGQCNIVMLTIMMLSVYYIKTEKPIRASLFLGFAIAFKLMPLILVGYYFLKGKYKVVLLSVLIAVGLTMIVPYFVYPIDTATLYLTSWFDAVLAPFFLHTEMATTTVSYYHTNQSLEAFLGRYFTEYGNDNYGVKSFFVLNTHSLKMISISCKAFFVLLVSILILKNRKVNKQVCLSEVSFFIYGIVIIYPVAWVNYYVLLLPLVLVFIAKISTHTILLKTIFAIGCLLTLVDVDTSLQCYSLHFIGGFMIFVATYLVCFRDVKALVV